MPVTTQKRMSMVNRGVARAIAGSVLVVLLSLPFALTLFPHGVTFGRHGAMAVFGLPGPRYRRLMMIDFADRPRTAEISCHEVSYVLIIW